jgi:hypothetical protein
MAGPMTRRLANLGARSGPLTLGALAGRLCVKPVELFA